MTLLSDKGAFGKKFSQADAPDSIFLITNLGAVDPESGKPDVLFSLANGNGAELTSIVGSSSGDLVDARAFGHAAPKVSDDYAIKYDYFDYLNSSISTLGGDDTIYAYAARQTRFDGGEGSDTLELYGRRSDYTFRFLYDAGGNLVTVTDQNRNTFIGIESIIFSDWGISDGLPLGSKLKGAIDALTGTVLASEWVRYGFDYLNIGGISGFTGIQVNTGDLDNVVTVADGDGAQQDITNAFLNTEAGKDFLSAGEAFRSRIDLGSDGNRASLVSLRESDLRTTGSFADDIEIGRIKDSRVDMGGGDDILRIIGTNGTEGAEAVTGPPVLRSSLLIGGDGTDRLVLDGLRSAWDFKFNYDSSGNLSSITTFNEGIPDSEIRGFEQIRFDDILLSLDRPTPGVDDPIYGRGKRLLAGTLSTLNYLTGSRKEARITPKIWDNFGFNILRIDGISGSETQSLQVDTGAGDDNVTLTDALAWTELRTGDGDDWIEVTFPALSDLIQGPFGRAVFNSRIDTGSGNDIINAQSDGNSGSVAADPLASPGYTNPDYFQSRIDAGEGDDYVYGFLPYASRFNGNAGTDTLLLYGTRSDWDLEFIDGNKDGIIDVLNNTGTDYILAGGVRTYNIADQNRIYGFEKIQFNDILVDLLEPPQDASDDAFGQDLLVRTLPALNGSVDADLWDAFAYNRLAISAVRGPSPKRIATIRTGAGDDTPTIGLDNAGELIPPAASGTLPSLRYAALFTEAGDDVVRIGTADRSSIDTGSGHDTVVLRGLLTNTIIDGGDGMDTLTILFQDEQFLEKQPNGDYRYGSNTFRNFENLSFSTDDQGYISRLGIKSRSIAPSLGVFEGGSTAFRVDNENAFRLVLDPLTGLLLRDDDVRLSQGDGSGLNDVILTGTSGADLIDARAFGHKAPTFRSGFEVEYDYPDYYLSTIDSREGNDLINAFFPIGTSFDGGAGDDRIVLYGKRSSYTLSLGTDPDTKEDVFRDADGNEFRNIETFQFSDLRTTAAALKEELSGSPEIPDIPSSNARPTIRTDLTAQQWGVAGNDGLVFAGIVGTPVRPITVSTGSGDNNVSLSDEIAYAALDTGDGNDLIRLEGSSEAQRGIRKSTLSTGGGDDALQAGSLTASQVDLGTGADRLELDKVTNASILGGSGDDGLTINGGSDALSGASLDGGTGTDRLALAGNRSSWNLSFRYDASGRLLEIQSSVPGKAVSSFRNFESFQFDDWKSGDQLARETRLVGTLPLIRGTIRAAEWTRLGYDHLNIDGIRGGGIDSLAVQTGSGDNTVILQNSSGESSDLVRASLSTGDGRDLLRLGSISSARIDTGDASDLLDSSGSLTASQLNMGKGADSVTLGSASRSEIVLGSGSDADNDNIEVNGAISDTVIRGGGGNDRLILRGEFPFGTANRPSVTDSTGTYYQLGSNRFYGFERVTIINPPAAPPSSGGLPGSGGLGGGFPGGLSGDFGGGIYSPIWNWNPSSGFF